MTRSCREGACDRPRTGLGLLGAALLLACFGSIAPAEAAGAESEKQQAQNDHDDAAASSKDSRTAGASANAGSASTGLAQKAQAQETPPQELGKQYVPGEWSPLGVILAVAFILLAVTGWWTVIRRNRNSRRERSRISGKLAGRDQVDGQFEALAEAEAGRANRELQRQVNGLERTVESLLRRIAAVEARVGGGVPERSGFAPSAGMDGMTLDRRNDRVELPEDRDTEQADAAPSATVPDEMLTPRGLVRLFNEATKPADHEALAQSVGAQYFTNERSGDLATLLKSEIDRFWLIPLGERQDEALLIPGFSIRKSWQKFRQPVSDHPLAFHFDLLRGEKFTVNKAARLRRDPNGSWQLVEKGEVSGLS